MKSAARSHGGADALGAARWDFSTCANAAGPCPTALAAVQRADVTRYPDPEATAVRTALAALHGVALWRVLPAASASEFIQRFTAVSARLWPGGVGVPALAYGDYAAAALACARQVYAGDGPPDGRITLHWAAEPSSPLGQDAPPDAQVGKGPSVLDAVYAPLEPTLAALPKAERRRGRCRRRATRCCAVGPAPPRRPGCSTRAPP